MSIPPFHLAFPVHDLDAARNFYGALLGCREGRSDRDWIDYDFYGHQIVAHVAPAAVAAREKVTKKSGFICSAAVIHQLHQQATHE